MAQCLHCRGQMFARRWMPGPPLQPGICPACKAVGVKWRDLDTASLVGSDRKARRFVAVALSDDPPDLPTSPYASAQCLWWARCQTLVVGAMAIRGYPRARLEGPTRGA